MGLSLSRIYSSLSSLAFWGKDKEVRILMVGLDSAGKVCFVVLSHLDQPALSNYDGEEEGERLTADDDSLPVADWRSRLNYPQYVPMRAAHVGARTDSSNRVQRRDGVVQKHQLPSMGPRRYVSNPLARELADRQDNLVSGTLSLAHEPPIG